MHLINSYSLGGAEKLVFDLVTKMDKDKFKVLICSVVKSENEVAVKIREDMESNGVRVLSLDKPPRKKRLRSIVRLCKYLRENHV